MSTTMHIAIDARMSRVTGIGRYIDELTSGLVRAGVRVSALVRPGDVAWWQGRHPTTDVHHAPEAIYSWSEQLILPARLQRIGADLIHFANFNLPVSWRRPYVVTIHDLIPLTFRGERHSSWVTHRAYREVLRAATTHARGIIVPTQHVRDQLAAWVTPDRVAVIHHAVSPHLRGPKSSPAERAELCRSHGITAPFVLYVGNYRQHKNVTTLLIAFAKFHETEPHSQLVLAGPMMPTQHAVLTDLIGRLKLQRAVICTGPITDREILTMYDSARVLVQPSFAEGFGLPPLEAATRGLPVIASHTTPIRELLGRGALSFDPRMPRQLTDALAVLWYNPILRSELVRHAQAAVLRTWDDVTRETIATYEKVLATNTKSR